MNKMSRLVQVFPFLLFLICSSGANSQVNIYYDDDSAIAIARASSECSTAANQYDVVCQTTSENGVFLAYFVAELLNDGAGGVWSGGRGEACDESSGYDPDGIFMDCAQGHYVATYPELCELEAQFTVGGEFICLEQPDEEGKDDGEPDCCKAAGNPINFGNGNKFQKEIDYQGARSFPMQFSRSFNTGGGWSYFYSLNEVYVSTNTLVCTVAPFDFSCEYVVDTNLYAIDAKYPDGRGIRFRESSSGTWISDPDQEESLVPHSSGYQFVGDNDEVVIFDASGRIESVTSRAGMSHTYEYSTNQIQITHEFGSSLTLDLNEIGKVSRLEDPAGGEYFYNYDSNGNLLSVAYPDGNHRYYTYDGSKITSVADVAGSPVTEWFYTTDGENRAYRSVKSGGAEEFYIDYSDIENELDPHVVVVNPLGKQTVYHFESIYGVNQVVEAERLASATSSYAQTYFTYDNNGYLASETDWNGNTTLYTHDVRGLETSRTEAFGTPDERTITTTWDSTFRLPLQIDEPGLTRTYTYDANGNMLSETLTDTNTNEVRTTTYTYNAYGQVLTIDGPRTDVSDVTTFTYDAQGNLSSTTNALSQTTQFTNYDAHGNLLSMTDPNGVVTQFTYDERQRLTSVTRAYGTTLAATTDFTYDYAGNIKRITQPNGAYIEYSYDGAYRVTSITDNLGNYIQYQLDDAGNTIGESVYDPSNVLKRSQTAVFDDLNRMLESTGASSQTYGYDYDDQGNTVANTDARLYETSFSFDALNRLIGQTNPNLDTASFAYDDQDRLTSVTDERGLTTTYSYNGFGELVSQISPDTGTTIYDYDSAGNLIEQTDARGAQTFYQYDAINRLLNATYVYGTTSIETYSYDLGINGIGQLTNFNDESGNTTFTYDVLGRVVSDTRYIYGVSKTTTYAYDLAGNITEIGYPSGAIVAYSRDAMGRTIGVDIDQSPAGSMLSLTSGVGYLPFGGVTGFTYGNGLVFSRQHDQDYRITNQAVSGGGLYEAVDYSYDANSNITDMDDLDDFTKSQLFQYDSLNRLYNEESDFYGEKTYTYDEVGNRTLRTLSAPGEATTNQTHTIDSGSNQLLSRGPRDYSYDAAGNTLAFDEPDGSPRREWIYNAQNRMEELSVFGELKARYQYNGLGQRVMKTLYQDSGSGPEEYQVFVFYYDQQGRLIQNSIYRPDTPVGIRHMRDRQFIWMDDMPVGYLETVYRANGSVLTEDLHYITADHLNAPAFATNQSGLISWKWDRDAFGLGELDLDPDGDGVNVNIRLRFPGQYDDEESITFYNYFRDYDPTIGRYMQSDPVGLMAGPNTYAYVENRPTVQIDFFGLIGGQGQMGRNRTAQDCEQYDEKCAQNCLKNHYGASYEIAKGASPFTTLSVGTSIFADLVQENAYRQGLSRIHGASSWGAYATGSRIGMGASAIVKANAVAAVVGVGAFAYSSTAEAYCFFECL